MPDTFANFFVKIGIAIRSYLHEKNFLWLFKPERKEVAVVRELSLALNDKYGDGQWFSYGQALQLANDDAEIVKIVLVTLITHRAITIRHQDTKSIVEQDGMDLTHHRHKSLSDFLTSYFRHYEYQLPSVDE